MNLQQIYNATYNHFVEEEWNPQYVKYDENWEKSNNKDIKNAFEFGKWDGFMRYLKVRKQNLTEEIALKMVEQMSTKETGRKI